MTSSRSILLALFPTLLSLSGCPTTDSDAIRTDALNVVYSVVQTGDRADLRADFRVGSELGTPVELSDGDEVSVNGTILTFRPGIFFSYYTGTAPSADVYRFELSRPGEESYVSTVRPALPVTITSPISAGEVSRGSGFAVSWEDPQADSLMSYRVFLEAASSECGVAIAHDVQGALTDIFEATEFLNEVLDEAGEPTGETVPVCEGETLVGSLAVDAFSPGVMSAALSGRIGAYTRASVDVTLQP